MTVRRVDNVPPARTEAPGIEVRRLQRAGDTELKVVDVGSDSSTPFHVHPHSHEAVVVSGAGTLRLEDGEHPLASGNVLSIAPNELHAIVGRGPETLRFVCMDGFPRSWLRREEQGPREEPSPIAATISRRSACC